MSTTPAAKQPITEVTRRYTFSASHRLHLAEFSDHQNSELFGKCNNPYGHGHNYELFVTARGPINSGTGMALSVIELDRLVSEHILKRFNMKNMNSDIAEFQHLIPTTENVGVVIRDILTSHWKKAFPGDWPVFKSLRIYETERNIFEVSA